MIGREEEREGLGIDKGDKDTGNRYLHDCFFFVAVLERLVGVCGICGLLVDVGVFGEGEGGGGRERGKGG